MLNEFVSVVISSNEEHRKLMEKTCLVRRQLPVALIEVPIFNKQGEHIRPNPGDVNRSKLCVCVQYVIYLKGLRLCLCVRQCNKHCYKCTENNTAICGGGMFIAFVVCVSVRTQMSILGGLHLRKEAY